MNINIETIEDILHHLWKNDDDTLNNEHRLCYNKALEDIQKQIDKLKSNQYDNLKTHYVGDIELSMTMEDAKYCYHQGSCKNEVNAVSLKDYIQEQLKEYSNPQLIQALKEYAIEDCETFNRKSMEEYIVWLIAGNIIDEYDNE